MYTLKKQFFEFVLYLNKKIVARYVYKILIKMEKNNKIKKTICLPCSLMAFKKFFFQETHISTNIKLYEVNIKSAFIQTRKKSL